MLILSDVIASLLALVCTLFIVQRKRTAWPIGLLAITINCGLFWHAHLWADLLKEMVFFILVTLAWIHWHNPDPSHLSVKTFSFSQRALLLLSLITGTLLMGQLLAHTHDRMPYYDSGTAITSLTAQWLSAQCYIESWWLWLAVDAAYSWIYWHQQLTAHTVLMLIYCAIAIYGAVDWASQSRGVK